MLLNIEHGFPVLQYFSLSWSFFTILQTKFLKIEKCLQKNVYQKQGLIEARTDSSILWFDASNLGAQINKSNKKRW